MTYCVGMRLDKGLIFMSDTRTNSGVDNISVFKKMFTWETPGERYITLMTAGNLATTQAVVSVLEERTKVPHERKPSIMEAPTMFQVARIIGETLREEIARMKAAAGPNATTTFSASIIVGGQIKDMDPKLFMVYPEGNFIEAGDDTPFFQIGETKYGRPILVRAYDRDMSFNDAIKLLMVSFDSTIKANLSVDLPLDLQIYAHGSFAGRNRRILADDPYYNLIANQWSEALKTAFHSLPDYTG
ncbi:peptidase [Blastomonas sp.]|uniref:peptidase n=1 Tax=Blastomonas sp. TaxID=1909299 RepID=UPI003593E69C